MKLQKNKIPLLSKQASKKLYRVSRRYYFFKMRGGRGQPQKINLKHVAVTWFFTIFTINILYFISIYTNSELIMAPFGATCVLIFGATESPLAQPRNVIGGHLIAATISVLLGQWLGDSWWVLALGVATAISVMQLTKTLHPPAGADPLVIITSHASWNFIFVPVLLGAVVLVTCAVLTNNFIKNRHYPQFWW
jgi:CBS-domain-containing membrane protein